MTTLSTIWMTSRTKKDLRDWFLKTIRSQNVNFDFLQLFIMNQITPFFLEMNLKQIVIRLGPRMKLAIILLVWFGALRSLY